MKQFKYFSDISESDLSNNVVIPCTDQNGMLCIFIKNNEEKIITNSSNTDKLIIKLNAVLEKDNQRYFFHVITSKNNDIYDKEQFNIIFEYLFKKIEKPISDSDLTNLIMSLETFFKITPDADTRKLQVGVYGELLFIKHMYDLGYTEIVEKYHHNFYSKHDVEITNKIRIEIKTTQGDKRIHNFGHQQIFRPDLELYVASLLIEPVSQGYSLFDLFSDVIKIYSNPDFILSLYAIMKRCNVSNENHGIQVSYQKAINDINILAAKDLPKFEMKEPKGITNVHYDVDCSFADEIDIHDFIHSMKTPELKEITYKYHDYTMNVADKHN